MAADRCRNSRSAIAIQSQASALNERGNRKSPGERRGGDNNPKWWEKRTKKWGRMGEREGGRGEGERSFGVRRTMVATNQRDYATISRMDMAGSHDKSSCRSVTINNNIWTDGCCDSPSLNSVIRARARLFRTLRTLLHARFISRDNKSRRRATDQRARARDLSERTRFPNADVIRSR